MFKRVVLVMTMIALLLLVGCGKAPETEMQNADTAMQAARSAEAEQYAADTYQMAMDTLNAATSSKQEQDSKFALFRSYGKAKELFMSAQVLAEQSATEAAAEKARMQSEVMTLINEVQATLGTADKAIAGAPKGKGTKADIELLKNDLAAAKAGFEAAKADFEAGKYIAAKVKLDAVKAKAEGVISDVEKAKSKKTPK